MGKGAWVMISNETDITLNVSYENIVDVYQNGDQGSDFGPITGTLEPHVSLPVSPGNPLGQYIEAISTSSQSNFDMVLSWHGLAGHDSVRLTFIENYHTWWVQDSFVKSNSMSLQFDTVVTPSGDQYAMAVSIKNTIDPVNWMEQVYDEIKNTSLCLLPIPGSHDAISYPDINARSQIQNKSVTGQLMAGFRYFDFRVKLQDGVYYGEHGSDTTDHDYTSVDPNKGHKPFVLDDIAHFLNQHPKELVILNFSHFDDFETAKDARDFVLQIQKHFGSKLVTRDKKPTVTYGACVDNSQQVIAIISDADDDGRIGENWYEYPPNTPAGKKERQDTFFWMTSDCWLDRYSAIKYHRGGDVYALIQETLQDQEVYLQAAKPGETGHRNLDKFWVTQAVLDCDALISDGHNMSYWSAISMNPLVRLIYEYNWSKGKTHKWGLNDPVKPVLIPNILLLDYSGNFDGFPEACVRMLKNIP